VAPPAPTSANAPLLIAPGGVNMRRASSNVGDGLEGFDRGSVHREVGGE
jgi:hypothetical protein